MHVTLFCEPSIWGPLPATNTVDIRKATVVSCDPKAHGTGNGVSWAKPVCAEPGGSASVSTVPAHPPAKVRMGAVGLAFACVVWDDPQPPTRMMSRAAAIQATRDLAPRSIAPLHRSGPGGSHRDKGGHRGARVEDQVGRGRRNAPSIRTIPFRAGPTSHQAGSGLERVLRPEYQSLSQVHLSPGLRARLTGRSVRKSSAA